MTTTWVDVVDTAVKIGFGVLAGGVVTLLVERLRRRADQQLRDEDLRRSRFVDPIVKFMDDVLGAITKAYWAHIDGREMNADMAFFQENQGAIEARVRALNDQQVAELWAPFTRKIIEVKIRLGKPDMGDPYEKMTEAFDLGGKLLRRLFRLRQ